VTRPRSAQHGDDAATTLAGEFRPTALHIYEQVSQQLAAGTLTASELTETLLARAARYAAQINCFTVLTAEEARRAATRADDETRRCGRWSGPIRGVPIAIKDCIDTAGIVTSAGSPLWRYRVPRADASVVSTLRVAGAVLIGKTNLDEWCYGAPSSLWGEVLNPWGAEWVVGGSSSGSAAAVAAGFCVAAIGTDSGGSIRYPAAVCGVSGLKPTNGRIARAGVTPTRSSLDSVGVIAADVSGCAAVYTALSTPSTPPSVTKPAEIVIGVESKTLAGIIDDEVAAAIESAAGILSRTGFRVVAADPSFVPRANSAQRTISLREAWQNHRERVSRDPERFNPRVRARLEVASRVTAREYVTACREREVISSEAEAFFSEIDVLLGPTLPCPPWRREQRTFDFGGGAIDLWDLVSRHLAWQNLTGYPALTVPAGLTTDGRPLAVQLSGRLDGEAAIFAAARAIELELPARAPALPPHGGLRVGVTSHLAVGPADPSAATPPVTMQERLPR
jgi:aspartyl-tRNA(Asn)/glutamyl-tRNA(Gln) amidotransferase subunit A